VSNPAAAVVDVLRTLRWEDHHSHPTQPFEVQIRCASRTTLRLALARDSQRTDEYWVFYNVNGGSAAPTVENEVGRLTTNIFAQR
jgi:hypothetical protein